MDRRFESFPVKPYSIQTEFMQSLYSALDERKIGLFESPTGTGKTLSLICGTMEWLEANRVKESYIQENEPEGDEPLWALQQFHQMAQRQVENRESLRSRKIQKTRNKTRQKRILNQGSNPDSEFLLSDNEEEFSAISSDDGRWEDGELNRRQIIFCSRTHSQLSQFIGEFKRTRFAESLSLITLASRKTLCLNESVSKLHSASAVNEKCLDLRNKKPSKKIKKSDRSTLEAVGGSCPFLLKRDDSDVKRHSQVNGSILSQPMDIEAREIVDFGNADV